MLNVTLINALRTWNSSCMSHWLTFQFVNCLLSWQFMANSFCFIPFTCTFVCLFVSLNHLLRKACIDRGFVSPVDKLCFFFVSITWQVRKLPNNCLTLYCFPWLFLCCGCFIFNGYKEMVVHWNTVLSETPISEIHNFEGIVQRFGVEQMVKMASWHSYQAFITRHIFLFCPILPHFPLFCCHLWWCLPF